MTLDAAEKALKQTGPHDFRDAITHLQVVDRADIPRMAKLGIVASTDPHWFDMGPDYFGMLAAVLGEERAEHQLPMKSFFDAGVVVTSASGYPVTDPAYPLIGMQKGILRQQGSGSGRTRNRHYRLRPGAYSECPRAWHHGGR